MAGRGGQKGPLFNRVQCKHDLFGWWGISQDILVWADLPKQPGTSVALCLLLRDKSLSYESSGSAWVCPKAKVWRKLFSAQTVWHDPHLSRRVLTTYSWDFLPSVFLVDFAAWLNQSVLRSLNQPEKHFISDSYVTLQFKRRFIDSKPSEEHDHIDPNIW